MTELNIPISRPVVVILTFPTDAYSAQIMIRYSSFHRSIIISARTLRTMTTMPRPLVTPAGRAALDDLLEREVASRDIPATFFGVTNADEEIYWACAGDKEYGNPAEQVTDQTYLQLFSMTKLVTSVSRSPRS